MAGPGRPPKGKRKQLTVKVPVEHAPVYELRARESGEPLTDYIAKVLAKAHELEMPTLERDPNQGVFDVAS